MSREHADRENEITQVSLTDFPGIRIGQAENRQGGTGITVLLSEDPKGMAAGLHIGGGGPAIVTAGLENFLQESIGFFYLSEISFCGFFIPYTNVIPMLNCKQKSFYSTLFGTSALFGKHKYNRMW